MLNLKEFREERRVVHLVPNQVLGFVLTALPNSQPGKY
jgi:hypothetical protein